MKDDPTRGMKRSDVLLLMIEQHCDNDGRFWVPSTRTEFVYIGRDLVNLHIFGAGDMSALNALVRKGMIEEVKGTNGIRLGYRITDTGKLHAQSVA